MRDTGIILIVLGFILSFFSFTMDTTVSADSYGIDKVVNIGKLNDKQNFVLGSVAICLIGSILFACGTIEQKLNLFRPGPPLGSADSNSGLISNKIDERSLSPRQKELQTKYEKSEITLEEYQRQWNKD